MLEWGPQEAGKVRGTKERQLEEHFGANQVNWKQVSNMIAILERQLLRSKDENYQKKCI